MIRLLALALLAAVFVASARAETFRTYANDRFGATAEYPSDWRSDPPPENGDGLVFRSPDGQATITISGILNIADTPDEAMRDEEKADASQTVTFRQHGRRSVVVSGTQGDKIFYRKSILVCRDQIWNHVHLEYPAARKTEYDALVAKVAGSLRFSGVSEQIQNCR
jgi:hypothetical protein